jgi:hypothetical protein
VNSAPHRFSRHVASRADQAALAALVITSVVFAQTTLPAGSASAPSGMNPVRGVGFSAMLPDAGAVGPPFAAIHDAAARKTFFAFHHGSAATPEAIGVASLDHASGTVARPTLLPPGKAGRAGDALSLDLDSSGTIWLCAGSGDGEPARLFKSNRPHEIGAFTSTQGPALGSPVLHVVGERGLLVLGLISSAHGTAVAASTSADGQSWSPPRPLVAIDAGQTFLTGRFRDKIGLVLAAFTAEEGPRAPGNVYYLESPDAGRSWQTVRRVPIDRLPIQAADHPTKVWDYRSARWAALLKSLAFDSFGNPVIAYLVGSPRRTGPPRYTWTTSRWTGREWETTGILPASSADDGGVLQVGADRTWRLLTVRNGHLEAPPGAAAEPRLAAWSSDDQGRSWNRLFASPGADSQRHAVFRPFDAPPDCDAFWISAADAVAGGPIRILDRQGTVLTLPGRMTADHDKPIPNAETIPPSTQPATRPE